MTLPSPPQACLLLLPLALASPTYPRGAPSSPGISYEPVAHTKVAKDSIILNCFLLRPLHIANLYQLARPEKLAAPICAVVLYPY